MIWDKYRHIDICVAYDCSIAVKDKKKLIKPWIRLVQINTSYGDVKEGEGGLCPAGGQNR